MTTLTTPIAQGRTAEIYAWEDGYVLKLYRDWCPTDWVEYESRIAHAVHAAGIPSPAAGQIVEVDGRRGLSYERVDGMSMLQDMNSRPWTLFKHARSLAELQAKIHGQSIDGLPTYIDRLRDDIRSVKYLNDETKNRILAEMDHLPTGRNVCHGDFHPGNVILTKTGPVVIDWMTACSGNPWTDVARTNLLLSIGAKRAGKQVNPIVRAVIRLYGQTYLNRYRALIPDTSNQLHQWVPIIAAARLNEEIVPEREALIKIAGGNTN